MRNITVSITLFFVLIALHAGAEQLPPEAQRILDDLGTSPAVQQVNNGKKFSCRYGGTKTVTVTTINGGTVFSGEYNNCREPGLNRDGYYEVIVQEWELVGQSYKRSVNGELFDAAVAGSTDKVRKLLKRKADVNYTESIRKSGGGEISGWTPLMSAALHGNLEMLKLLVKAGAWVNYLNGDAANALWIASDTGNLKSVKFLLANRAYVNNSSSDNTTPLMVAAKGGYAAVVKSLISAKAALNLVHKDGDSALMIALANGHSDIAQILIKSRADINIQNKFGVTALIIAVAEGNEPLVDMLLEYRADITRQAEGGKTALDIAVAKGNKRLVEVLTHAQHGK